MHEFRIHGRGGQGVNTVGLLLAQAFFARGFFTQTFATYGAERRGAPVTAFVRVAPAPIHRRCDVEQPEAVLLFEPAFLTDGTGLAGLPPGALVLVNTVHGPAAFAGAGPWRVVTVDALGIARANGLGRMVNTAMLGAFCRAAGLLPLEQVEAVLQEHAPRHLAANLGALRQAYAAVAAAGGVAGHA